MVASIARLPSTTVNASVTGLASKSTGNMSTACIEGYERSLSTVAIESKVSVVLTEITHGLGGKFRTSYVALPETSVGIFVN
ncbi:hypothetical protein D3C75_1099760 [compost metagenome]